jgi:hypothetical protein
MTLCLTLLLSKLCGAFGNPIDSNTVVLIRLVIAAYSQAVLHHGAVSNVSLHCGSAGRQ